MNKKKVILSSLVTIGCCASLMGGATYALFTSSTETGIEITSGTVDVTAKVGDITTHTPNAIDATTKVITDNSEYGNPAVSAEFDGTTNVLSIKNIMPGDVVTVPVTIANQGTVAYNWRMTITPDSSSDSDLIDQLIIGVTTTDSDGNTSTEYYSSLETAYKACSKDSDGKIKDEEITLTIELPTYATNASQGKSASLTLAVEAIQGNATASSEETAKHVYKVTSQDEITALFDSKTTNGEFESGETIVFDCVYDSTNNSYSNPWSGTNAFAATIETEAETTIYLEGYTVDSLTINAPNAEVYLNGEKYTNVTVAAAAENSVYVSAPVGTLTLNEGHVVLEKTASVTTLNVEVSSKAEKDTFVDVEGATVEKIEVKATENEKVTPAVNIQEKSTVTNVTLQTGTITVGEGAEVEKLTVAPTSTTKTAPAVTVAENATVSDLIIDNKENTTAEIKIENNGTVNLNVADGASVDKVEMDGEGVTESLITTAAQLTAAIALGETVDCKLGANITADVQIAAGKTVKLDLNGYTLANSESDTITNYGTLTITGEGTIDNVTHRKAALLNYGTATLDGGTFTRSKENGKTDTSDGGNSWYVMVNYGKMTITGATVEGTSGFSSLVENGFYNNDTYTAAKENITSDSIATLVIEDGTFSGGLNTIKNDDLGNLTINGGTYTNYTQYCVLNWNVAEITNGTFDGSKATATVCTSACEPTITGVTGDIDSGKLTIEGGTFIAADGGYALRISHSSDTAEIYPTVTYGEGMKALTTVHTVSSEQGLRNAISYALSGDTLYISKNITLTSTLEITENITLTAAEGATVTGKYLIWVHGESEDDKVTVNISGGSYKSTDGNTFTVSCYGTLIFNDGTVESQEACVAVGAKKDSDTKQVCKYSGNGTLIVNGGTFTSKDNAVILTNGTVDNGSYTMGGNTIEIKGGTFNANISSSGYIACGIYVANKDIVTVTGGTFNISGGVGVAVRGGETTIGADVTFNITSVEGRESGKVGDGSQSVAAGYVIVVDKVSGYPDTANITYTYANATDTNVKVYA